MKHLFSLVMSAGLMIFLGGCLAWERGPQSSPGKLMEAYLEALQQSDLPTMLQLSDSPDVDEEELAFLEKFIEMIELESYSIDGVELLSDDEALVKITVKLLLVGQEKRHTERVRVIRKEGKWYLREGILEMR